MRVVFFGTPECAVPYLQAVRDIGGELVAVVTQPDRPRGRSGRLCPPPVKEEAAGLQLCLLQPESCRDPLLIAEVEEQEPDIALVVAFGQILCPELLSVPRVASLNVHYSLLPQFRGAAPVQHALLDGLPETGVTLQHMGARLDAGDIVAQARLDIAEEDDTQSLTERLTALGCQLVREFLPRVMNGTAPRHPQDESQATLAPRLRKQDGLIDWRQDADQIANRVRAVTPWPGAATEVGGQRLLIRQARTWPERAGAPGHILELPTAAGRGPVVAAGSGAVELLTVQPEGKRSMGGGEYLRGARLSLSDAFVSLVVEHN
ncbi:MAG: methionyl-tRNA formyltransferase [Armatimonadetes bacterium]|nr:methionyl-tRNA formyltransferase [Armatimonadota bacterium]